GCRYTTCWWRLESWTTLTSYTPLITATTSASLAWSRASPCPTSLTSECPSTYEALTWKQGPCKYLCVYVCVCVCEKRTGSGGKNSNCSVQAMEPLLYKRNI